jgi:serine O-acetyltransferase
MANLGEDTRRLRSIKKKRFPWYVLESLLFENGYQAVVLYRIASFFKRNGIPLLGPLFARLSLFLTGVDIAPGAEIGPGLMISHGVGIVVGNATRIGSDALLMHQVTLGAPTVSRIGQMPTIGNNVVLGAGAKVIGGVTIGDNVFVGVNAIVTQDVPADSKVVAQAGIDIRTEPRDAESENEAAPESRPGKVNVT